MNSMYDSSAKYRKDTVLQDLGDGVTRRILSYNEDIMMVEVSFQKGSVGSVHTHLHTQATYVLKGSFCFTINGVEVVVNQGDTLHFNSNEPHGTVCLEEGTLLDVFTPMREDFV